MKPVFLFIASAAMLSAQSITGSGYLPPAAVSVAPGQIATFYASGIGKSIFSPGPAPAGFTATLRQGTTTLTVPILEVRPVTPCPTVLTAQAAGINLCASFLGVTVQIPYEVTTRLAGGPAALLLLSDGTSQSAIELNPLNDQVHILTVCDLFLNASQAPPSLFTGLPCTPYVTHADGTLISASTPAKIGETVVAWALGLGATNPAATTGRPATQPMPSAQTFSISYQYKVNTLPSRPYSVTLPLPAPAYTGLSTGYPGLYQINFLIPAEPPNGTPRCVLPGAFVAGGNYPQSNLTVSFGGTSSFDGAGLCVDTHIPVD